MLFARVPQGVLIKAGLGFHSVPFFLFQRIASMKTNTKAADKRLDLSAHLAGGQGALAAAQDAEALFWMLCVHS